MRRTKRFLEPVLALANVGGSRVVRAIREPERDITASQPSRDCHALAAVIESLGAHARIRVAKRPELVVLILKEIRVDGARHHAGTCGEGLDLASVFESTRKIPLHVQGDRRTDARDRVHVSGITEFFGGRRRRSRLQIFAEARAGVRESPRRQLDAERIERADDGVRASEFMIAPSIAARADHADSQRETRGRAAHDAGASLTLGSITRRDGSIEPAGER